MQKYKTLQTGSAFSAKITTSRRFPKAASVTGTQNTLRTAKTLRTGTAFSAKIATSPRITKAAAFSAKIATSPRIPTEY